MIPPVEPVAVQPIPKSTLKYFPNHLAYRPDDLLPPPSRFRADEPSTLDGLNGERLEILAIIQMPTEPWPVGKEVNEEEQVIREWGGVEIGISKLGVGPQRSA